MFNTQVQLPGALAGNNAVTVQATNTHTRTLCEDVPRHDQGSLSLPQGSGGAITDFTGRTARKQSACIFVSVSIFADAPVILWFPQLMKMKQGLTNNKGKSPPSCHIGQTGCSKSSPVKRPWRRVVGDVNWFLHLCSAATSHHTSAYYPFHLQYLTIHTLSQHNRTEGYSNAIFLLHRALTSSTCTSWYRGKTSKSAGSSLNVYCVTNHLTWQAQTKCVN